MTKTLVPLLATVFLTLGGVALAQTPTPSPSPSPALSCVKAAVDKRETAIQSAMDTFHNSVKTALQNRKTALLAAWNITNTQQRKAAILKAWQTFRTEYKNAKKAFNDARKAAWTQFGADRKACKGQPTGEEQGADLSF